MKKLVIVSMSILLAVLALSGCRTIFGRGHGPVDSFAFLPQNNPGLTKPVTGTIREGSDPKSIEVVVPPGTDLSGLVATISLNTEGTITVISSGAPVRQQNGVTPNNFESPVLYSITVPKEKEPWNYRVTVRHAETNAKLALLRVDNNTALDPPFNPGVSSYSTTVPYASTSVQIDASGQSVHLQNIVVDGNMSRGRQARVKVPFTGTDQRTITIESTAEDGVTTVQYTLTINRGAPDRNSALRSLVVHGSTISPQFRPDVLTYVAQVPYAARSVDVSAVPQSSFAAVGSGTSAGSGTPTKGAENIAGVPAQGNLASERGGRVAFEAGNQLSIPIVVTAQDGSTTVYRVDIVREAPDSNNYIGQMGLNGAELTTQFNPGRLTYTAQFPFAATSFHLAINPQSRFATVDLGAIPGPGLSSTIQYTGNPNTAAGATVNVAGVNRATLSLLVTAQDGSQRRYVVHIQRMPPDSNTNLGGLSVSPGTLVPGFSPRVAAYGVTIPGTAPEASITARTASEYASIGTADSSVATSGSPTERTLTLPVPGGQTRSVDIVVTAQDGSQRLYKVTVTREQPPAPKDNNASLSSIVLDGGTLSPAFSANQLSYSVTLPTSQNRVSVYPIAASRAASVSIDGQRVGNQPITFQLQPGYTQRVTIIVTAETGTSRQYTITITRERPSQSQAPQQPSQPAAPAAQQPAPPPTSSAPSTSVRMVVHLTSSSVRLDKDIYNELRSARDSAGNEATIVVRPYRGTQVLSRGTSRVNVKQAGNSPTVLSTSWTSPAISMSGGRLVEVEISIRTARGKYLYYEEAVPVSSTVSIDVPFYLYAASPQVSWPAIGSLVQVAGVESAMNGGFFDQSTSMGKQERPGNESKSGDVRLSVRGADGKQYGFELDWDRASNFRSARVHGSNTVRVAEGSTVSYSLIVKGRSGRGLTVSRGGQVWTTMLKQDGGFEPASIYVFDDLQ